MYIEKITAKNTAEKFFQIKTTLKNNYLCTKCFIVNVRERTLLKLRYNVYNRDFFDSVKASVQTKLNIANLFFTPLNLDKAT